MRKRKDPLGKRNEEFTIRDVNRQQSAVKKPKFIKIREMRESEDINDYFTVLEIIFLYSEDICPFKSSFWSDI